MSVKTYKCPSCGAVLKIENRFSKLVICSYCGQTCLVTDEGLDPAGKQAKLADFESIFHLGSVVRIKDLEFKVLGRLRYKYEDGFWDEWFLVSADGKKVWLQEDEGDFVMYEKETLNHSIKNFDEIEVGQNIEINKQQVFVTEKLRSIISGGEGELMFKAIPGEKINIIDGNLNGKLVSVEYCPDEINLSSGQEVLLSDIVIK